MTGEPDRSRVHGDTEDGGWSRAGVPGRTAWVDVDNDVVAAGAVLEVASAVAPMSFSDGSGAEPFARIERDGHVLELDVPFDLPKPSVSRPSARPGDDLVGAAGQPCAYGVIFVGSRPET